MLYLGQQCSVILINNLNLKLASSKPSSSTDLASIPRRVSEIIRNVPLETSYLSPYCKIEDTSDIQKKYTRIAMLRMREELNDLTVADSHHAHEYFVVNSFRMFYSLESSSSAASSNDEIENFKGYSVPSQFVSLKIETVNNVLDEVSRHAIFPKDDISYTDYENDVMTKKREIPVDWKHIEAVCKFVQEKKEFGACSQDLLVIYFIRVFRSNNYFLYKISNIPP